MTKVYNSIIEIEKDFLPKDYQKRLAKLGEVEGLIKYSKKESLKISNEIKTILFEKGSLARLIFLQN